MPTARCTCGALTATVATIPPSVVACHCDDCQRRTGSPFGVGIYTRADTVTIAGASIRYTRPGRSGTPFVTHFCPTCGTSLFWTTGRHPDLIGIAAGGFAGEAVPPPIRSVWEARMHDWAALPDAAEHHPWGTDGQPGTLR